MNNPILCSTCKKGDGVVGMVRAFRTAYGYRMHLRSQHGLKESDGKLIKARPRRSVR